MRTKREILFFENVLTFHFVGAMISLTNSNAEDFEDEISSPQRT
jgi:hypothetical protein